MFAVGLVLSGSANCKGGPLQGGVEQEETLKNQPLQGGAQGGGDSTGLQGGADQWSGAAQQGTMGTGAPLQGGAAGGDPLTMGVNNDPDANDQELQIEWDRWRNNLMQAIQDGTLQKINVQNDVNFVFDASKNMMVSRYPNGMSAWYSIDVLPNKKITNIKLTTRSKFASYDQAVLQAINDLQGKPLLTYPAGSKRKIVSQEASVRTAGESSSQEYKFGDVERQRY